MKKIGGVLILSLLGAAPFAYSAPAGTLSVHILNQQDGLPSPQVSVTLEKKEQDKWVTLATDKTDNDGRIKSFFPADKDMTPGIYKVTFKTGDYFQSKNMQTFFPEIPVIFNVAQTNSKLHIPLLLSQYGYSTYRGS